MKEKLTGNPAIETSNNTDFYSDIYNTNIGVSDLTDDYSNNLLNDMDMDPRIFDTHYKFVNDLHPKIQ